MNTQLSRERWFPWTMGSVAMAALVFAHLHYDIDIPKSEGYKTAILTLGGIFAGFMATLNALLFTMADAVFVKLKDSGYLADLVLYLKEAIWSSLALCLITCAAFWIPDKYWYVEVLIAGMVVFSTSAVFRISKISTYLLADRGT